MIISRHTKWERVRTQLLSKARARMTQGFQELILACSHFFKMANVTLLKPNAPASVSICFFCYCLPYACLDPPSRYPEIVHFREVVFGHNFRARFGPGFGFGGDFRVWSKRSPPESWKGLRYGLANQSTAVGVGGEPIAHVCFLNARPPRPFSSSY